jgi:hypothetical protein
MCKGRKLHSRSFSSNYPRKKIRLHLVRVADHVEGHVRRLLHWRHLSRRLFGVAGFSVATKDTSSARPKDVTCPSAAPNPRPEQDLPATTPRVLTSRAKIPLRRPFPSTGPDASLASSNRHHAQFPSPYPSMLFAPCSTCFNSASPTSSCCWPCTTTATSSFAF